MSQEKMAFQAEVSRLLHLMVNSVYSEKEIFLRELISNASDACDKLRYRALTEPALIEDDPDFKVTVTFDTKAKTLEIADNGIGMNRDDLVSDLGTIARSGTGQFLDQLTGDADKDVALIGQFGVGFYSVFMVADKVTVTSRKAGEQEAWVWESDGLGEFSVESGERAGRGTSILIHLKAKEKEWLEEHRLRSIITTYSDHIALPIYLEASDNEKPSEPVNTASALWTRQKKDITEEQYREFYHHVGQAFDEPWQTIHYRAEGKLEYSVLIFIPESKPYDLFDPARRHRVKLYVKRVFITDECEGLVPAYLRFLRGIIDTEDLPLNISREMLQASPVLARLKSAVTKRVITELTKRAKKEPEAFAKFWDNFGAVIKEGLYEDHERRDDLLKLVRFRSTTSGEDLVSLADYVERMKDKQSEIYYITGDDKATLALSPQLEGYRARGIEVLLLSDPVDDFWLSAVQDFDGKPFKSVTRGSTDLDAIAPLETETDDKDKADDTIRDADIATLIALFKQTLGDKVKDVKQSERLTSSAVCLVADDGDMDMHLARILKSHGQGNGAGPRIMEVNAKHALIRSLASEAAKEGAADRLADFAWLLYDQATIQEGETIKDVDAFARRLTGIMSRGLSA